MTRPAEVALLWETGDLTYPRFAPGHPRNRSIDWRHLNAVLRGDAGHEHDDVGDVDVFVEAPRRIHAVMLGGLGFLVSDALRLAFEPLVPGQVEFVPLQVNGERFWFLRVVNVVDALDRELSTIRYFSRDPDEIDTVEVPAWRGDVIDDPSIFKTPEHPTNVWVTPAIVDAYERSGCDGLSFSVRGRVV